MAAPIPSASPRRSLALRATVVATMLVALAACRPANVRHDPAGSAFRMRDRSGLACDSVVTKAGAPAAHSIRWVVPAADDSILTEACRKVGPAVVDPVPAEPVAAPTDDLVVVSWNTHIGVGDFRGLLDSLAARHGGRLPPMVLLLQEVFRDTRTRAATAASPDAMAARPSGYKNDIRALADSFGLALYYPPSMQDGGRRGTDRGNAIASNLVLSEFKAVELPFEAQRRVTAVATVVGRRRGDSCWRLRVASTHLDPVSRYRRDPGEKIYAFETGVAYLTLRSLTGKGRVRQVRGLLESLGGATPMVLGGDLNALRGRAEPAADLLRVSFPSSPRPSEMRTHLSRLQTDFLFFRLPEEVQAPRYEQLTRGPGPGERSFFGSDHSPLVGYVPVTSLPPAACAGTPEPR